MQFEHGNNLSRVKVSNQAAIKKLIYYCGPILRSEIADRLSLTLPTITTNINSMIASGAVQEVAETVPTPKRLGRKANPVDIIDDFHFFIGVEMRLRSRHICIADFRGNLVYSLSDPRTIEDYDENVAQVCQMITEAINSNIVPYDKIAGIGVCVPGLIDNASGKLISHFQYGWYDKDLIGDITNGTGFSGLITVANDACARAIAAQHFRHQELADTSMFAYLFISRGISCPFVINNSLYESKPLGPGELGYMIINPALSNDDYRYAGSLNSLSGERSIMERCGEVIANGTAPILSTICNQENTSRPSITQILKAQESGEKSVCDIITNAITYLGIAIANIDNFIHTDYIFIEGRLFSNQSNRELFLETVSRFSLSQTTQPPKFIFVDFEELNGAKSAVAVAIKADLETYIE